MCALGPRKHPIDLGLGFEPVLKLRSPGKTTLLGTIIGGAGNHLTANFGIYFRADW